MPAGYPGRRQTETAIDYRPIPKLASAAGFAGCGTSSLRSWERYEGFNVPWSTLAQPRPTNGCFPNLAAIEVGMRKRNLTPWIAVGIALTSVAVIVFGVATYRNTVAVRQSEALVVRSYAVREKTRELLSSVKDMEQQIFREVLNQTDGNLTPGCPTTRHYPHHAPRPPRNPWHVRRKFGNPGAQAQLIRRSAHSPIRRPASARGSTIEARESGPRQAGASSSVKLAYHRLKPLLAIVLFGAVAYLLHRELSHYRLSQIRAGFAAMPGWRIVAAIGLAAANHLIYVGYDALGLRSIGRRLRVGQIFSASLLGYIASNNFGPLLGGTSVRYRLYSSFGLSSLEVVKISAMLLTTFLAGLFSLAAVVFLARPIAWPESLHFLPFKTTQPLAILLIAIVVLYFAMNVVHALVPKQWREVIPLPGVKIGILQILVACGDILLATTILYVLISATVTIDYLTFLGVFLLAILAVMFTNVPGGLGVFEFTILALLPTGHSPEILGALLIYRMVFYLLPLAAAVCWIGVRQAVTHRAARRHFSHRGNSAAAGRAADDFRNHIRCRGPVVAVDRRSTGAAADGMAGTQHSSSGGRRVAPADELDRNGLADPSARPAAAS